MINQIITNIKQDLSQILTPDQMEALSRSLNKHLPMLAGDKPVVENTKHDMLPLFIAAKRVEGCSEKSLRYYESTIRNMLETINKPECQISTEDLRGYLDTYQRRGTVSKVTLDNVRRILHVSTDYLLMGSEPSKEEVKNDLLSIISELSTIAKKI